jgi:multicomponent Na+:H+ antiporter subunit D
MSTAGLSSLLPLPVAIPIAGAVAAPLAARVSRRLPLLVCMATMGAALVVLVVLASAVVDGRLTVHYLGHWGPANGRALGIAFAADPFGIMFALAVASIGSLLLLSTLSELGRLGPRELGGYACLFQLLLAALIGSALTADLFNLFVWFEVAALASYGLTGFFLERPIALEAAFKVLVLTTLASFAIFVGTALLYRSHGALNFGQLHEALARGVTTPDRIALALVVAGFATKAGLVPFHGWLPDAHTAAPGPVSAMFSGLMVNLGIVAIGRIVLQLYGSFEGSDVLGLLMGLGLVSAVVGAALALAQDDLKRLLAYDTISQMGVLAVGLATASANGVAGAAYHLLDHALFKALLFLCAGAIVHSTGETALSKMGGLARQRPALATAFTLGVVAIAGVPPLNGYASVGMIHEALQTGDQIPALAIMLAAQAITIAALGRGAYLAFYRRRVKPYGRLEPLRAGAVAALATLGGLCVAAGVLSAPIIDRVAGPAAASLLRGAVYARGVLRGGARLPSSTATFHYLSLTELSFVAVTLAAGTALAVRSVRSEAPAPLGWLRAIHTGSVNDYAALAVLGTVVALAVVAR